MNADRTLIVGRPVLTMEQGRAPIPTGGVVLERDRIVAVGELPDLARYAPFARTLGGEDFFVMPGLVNAHHHAGRTLRAGLADVPFERRNVYLHAIHPGLNESSIYFSTLCSCAELIRSGVTSVLVMYYPAVGLPEYGARAAIQAYCDSGIRVGFAMVQRDRNLYTHIPDGEFLKRLPSNLQLRVRESAIGKYGARSLSNDEYFDAILRLSKNFHGHDGRVFIHVGPDWYPACTSELLMRASSVASELDTQIQMHLLETPYEMLMAHRESGKSAVRVLADLGFLEPRVVCAHCVWVDKSDMRFLSEAGVTVAHNPASNLRLGSGIAPLRELLQARILVAIGSDGLAFSDDNDLMSEVRLAGLLQRRPDILGEPIDPSALLEMATANGAHALGLGGKTGRLMPGYLADIVIAKRKRIFSLARESVPPQELIVARMTAKDVDGLLVDGRVVLSQRRILTFDEEKAAGAIESVVAGNARTTDWVLGEEVEKYVVDVLRGWRIPDGTRDFGS